MERIVEVLQNTKAILGLSHKSSDSSAECNNYIITRKKKL